MPSHSPALPSQAARTQALRGHGAMLLFALMISGSFTLGGMAAPHLDPVALNAVRFVLACCVMGAAITALGGWRGGMMAAPWRYLALGAPLALYFSLMFVALRLTDPVSTGAVFTLTPLMAAGFGWLLLRQQAPPILIVSLLLAAAGAIWVIFRGDIDAILGFRIGRGEWIFLIGCAGHAFYTPLVRRLNRGEPVLLFTFWTLAATTSILLMVGAEQIVKTDWAALPAIVFIAIVYLAVFPTATTFFLIQYATLRLPASKVMAYGYLVPAFVIVWEGLVGHGWASVAVIPGVAATILALLILLRE